VPKVAVDVSIVQSPIEVSVPVREVSVPVREVSGVVSGVLSVPVVVVVNVVGILLVAEEVVRASDEEVETSVAATKTARREMIMDLASILRFGVCVLLVVI
jgi:hypothetical protein